MKKIWMLRWSFYFILLLICSIAIFAASIMDIFKLNLVMILILYIFIPVVIGLIFSYVWASLYWSTYRFEIGSERIIITSGVIGRRIINIPYERVQNVNIWSGVLERIFHLYSIEVETAGASTIRGIGWYGTRTNAEGSIQGIINPQPIVEYILAKSRGRNDLGDFKNKR